jgi:hypothetical protein
VGRIPIRLCPFPSSARPPSSPMLVALSLLLYPLVVIGALLFAPREPRGFAATRRAYNVCLSAFSAAMCAAAAAVLWRESRIGAACRLPLQPMPWYEGAFLASKIVEWMDTVWLVMGRKPLSRLHVLHHWSTAAVVAAQLPASGGRSALFDQGVLLNCFAHTGMYAYYAFPVTLRRARRWVTSVQLTQHFLMLSFVLHSLVMPGCPRDAHGNLGVLAAYVFNALEFSLLMWTPRSR